MDKLLQRQFTSKNESHDEHKRPLVNSITKEKEAFQLFKTELHQKVLDGVLLLMIP